MTFQIEEKSNLIHRFYVGNIFVYMEFKFYDFSWLTVTSVKGQQWSVSSVQLLSHVQLFETPWIAAHQASLSITNSQSLLKLMSIELVMPASHLILCRTFFCPPIPPSIRVFSNESMTWGGQRIGVSAPVLPINTQDWSPLGWTGWISLQSKGL